jgi:ubiquinone/menaquinone biosynthesis C-methylase UbiE
MRTPEFEQVLAANVEYHEALAESYDATQPHFLPENVARVNDILSELRARFAAEDAVLVDLGTGTGFVLNVAKRHFRKLIGIDATPAMLARVDVSGAQIELHVSQTESMPFIADSSVSVVTGYSFVHHLFDIRKTLAESFRVLHSGGILYIDQDPNRNFWELMRSMQNQADLPPLVHRERESVLSVVDDIAEEFGLAAETVELAEFQKVRGGGLDGDLMKALLLDVGFRKVEIRYEWYLGEGQLRRSQGEQTQRAVGDHLKSLLPATRHLFKYISFIAEK